jgi:hypothetical protein
MIFDGKIDLDIPCKRLAIDLGPGLQILISWREEGDIPNIGWKNSLNIEVA